MIRKQIILFFPKFYQLKTPIYLNNQVLVSAREHSAPCLAIPYFLCGAGDAIRYLCHLHQTAISRPGQKRPDLRSSTGTGTDEYCQGAQWELQVTSGGTVTAIIYFREHIGCCYLLQWAQHQLLFTFEGTMAIIHLFGHKGHYYIFQEHSAYKFSFQMAQ